MKLPEIALSIHQPWAWAIVAGHKDVENRSTRFAVAKGGMAPCSIAIHASRGMTRREYESAAAFMATLGVVCPRPDVLVRGAVVGVATVVDIVNQHSSPWFFGPRGLVLEDASATEPVLVQGVLGFFRWHPLAGVLCRPLPWMLAWPNLGSPLSSTPTNHSTEAALSLFGEG
jgi:hypothetical protein